MVQPCSQFTSCQSDFWPQALVSLPEKYWELMPSGSSPQPTRWESVCQYPGALALPGGVPLRPVSDTVCQFPCGTELQSPTGVTGLKTLLPFSDSFPVHLPAFPGTLFPRNCLPRNPCLGICFWGNPNYDMCYDLNVCVPSLESCETLVPKMMVLGGRACGRCFIPH